MQLFEKSTLLSCENKVLFRLWSGRYGIGLLLHILIPKIDAGVLGNHVVYILGNRCARKCSLGMNLGNVVPIFLVIYSPNGFSQTATCLARIQFKRTIETHEPVFGQEACVTGNKTWE